MTGLEFFGAVDATLGMISNIYKTYICFRDAPWEIRSYCDELESLRRILTDIGVAYSSVSQLPSSFLSEQRQQDAAVSIANPNSTQSRNLLGMGGVLVSIQACESECNTAWRAVSQLHSDSETDWKTALSKVGKSVKRILKTEGIRQSTQRLERLKQSLVLSMLLSGMTVDRCPSRHGSLTQDVMLESLGSMVNARMQNLQDEVRCNLRLLENQVINRVESLSSTAKVQHSVTERLIEESSMRFADIGIGGMCDGHNDTSPAMSSSNPKLSENSPSSCEIPDSEHLPESYLGETDATKQSKQESAGSLFTRALDRFRSEKRSRSTVLSRHMRTATDLQSVLTIMTESVSSREKATFVRMSRRMLHKGDIFVKVVNVMGQSTLIPFMQPLQVVLMLALRSVECLVALLDTITEIQDALIYCEREYALYQEPEMKALMETLYFESISFFESGARHLSRPLVFWLSSSERFKHDAKKITKLAKKVVREAEHFHRREVRGISNQVQEVNRKQGQIIRAVDDQRRIMESLQEEQKVLASVADHQQVLQALQELLARFPPSLRECPRLEPDIKPVRRRSLV